MTGLALHHPVAGVDEPTCCPWCGRALDDRAELHRHINTTHNVSTSVTSPPSTDEHGNAVGTLPLALGGDVRAAGTLPPSPGPGGPTP